MKKIYDCFLFFNELETLELRLEILNDIVDKFIIVESTVTFSGKEKKLFFNENKEKFKKFEDKIIHVIINDTPEDFINLPYVLNPLNDVDNIKNKILKHVELSEGWKRHEKQWGRETYQREGIFYGINECSDDDIILISDLDEIPNPIEIENIKNNISNQIFDFKQTTYYYYFNLLKEYNWSGTKCLLYGNLKNKSINLIRQNKNTTNQIENGGWHFSFMGGVERVKTKIDAYSHQEFNNPHIISSIENNINGENDPFFRGKLSKVKIDSNYPKYILDNLDKYSYMIKQN
jgi:beta-1,4-mannosyl-glycoprotein beta-1,4-N-acetylglucosaminyltransferase